jgi:hypothetical protein
MAQNAAVRPSRRSRCVTQLGVGSLLLVTTVGCGAGDRPATGDGDPAASGGAPAAPASSPPTPAPCTTGLTEQGTRLSFGDTATVAYRQARGDRTLLALAVRRARKGSVQDFTGLVLDRYTRSSTPYYVDVSVRNVGGASVGEDPVPLWGVDDRNRLLPPAAFATTFDVCPSRELPDGFAPGDRLRTCLVFLAPDRGTLRAVSFRPSQQFRPIVWRGQVAQDSG